MKASRKEKLVIKGWNIRLNVSFEEETQIKMEAIKKGMKISEYIKQTLLESLSLNKISTQASKNQSQKG